MPPTGMTVVRHIPAKVLVVVVKLERFEILIVFELAFDYIYRRLLETFTVGKFVRPYIGTNCVIVPSVTTAICPCGIFS